MTIQNTFHKAAGSTQAVLNGWKQQEETADSELEKQESIVRKHATFHNITFREAKKQFPEYKAAHDEYLFWNNKVNEMRQAQKEARKIW